MRLRVISTHGSGVSDNGRLRLSWRSSISTSQCYSTVGTRWTASAASISIPIRFTSLEQSGPQLFPQPESLCAEFLCRVRRGLLRCHARSEADRRLALDGRPESISSKFRANCWSAATAIPISGVVNQQWNELTGRAAANWTPKLDFTDQTLIYGSYRAWLQGRRRQSAGRRCLLTFIRNANVDTPTRSSADIQAGIHRCLRARHQEYAARRRADAERRCLLLQLQGLSDFARSWTAPRSM